MTTPYRNHTMRSTSFMLPLLVAAIVSSIVPAGTAAAQDRGTVDFQWQKRLPAGQKVSLRNINGNIAVTPASGDQVEVVGRNRYGSGNVRVEVVESADGVVICALRGDMRCDERGIRGRSHDGDDNWNRERMDLEVRMPRNLVLDVSSVSGDVTVTGVQTQVKANSVSGDVTISGAQTEVRAGSVSGDVRLQGLRVSRLSASTVSGELTIAVDQLEGSEELRFSSVSGDVLLTLPRNFGADLRMTTVSGDIDSSFPITLDGRMSRRRLEGRIGDGGRQMTVSTVSGDLRLRAAQ